MAREVLVKIGEEWVTKSRDGIITDEYIKKSNYRATDPFHGFGSDYINGAGGSVVNPINGKRYDSKSQYNRAVMDAGCRIVGNDYNNKDLSRKEIRGNFDVRQELKQAVERVKYGN